MEEKITTITVHGRKVDIYKGTGEKKYKAVFQENEKKKTIQFGDKNYEQYHDKIGLYKSKDHWDKQRRENYKTRHEKDLKYNGKITAGVLANELLW